MNRNTDLLFGLIALQVNFLSRGDLLAAMQTLALDKDRSLGEVLLEKGWITPERDALLSALVRDHLEAHGKDASRSLSAIRSHSAEVNEAAQLLSIPETRVGASEHDSSRPAEGLYATRVVVADPPGTAGRRFLILRPLGKGGLGEVFVALDTELNREVALKQIREHFADNKDSQRRLLLEGEITGGLEHPSIVPVYGLGRNADGRPFYAMRFIHGETLEEVIGRFHQSDGPASGGPQRTLELYNLLRRFLDVCNAMSYAHSKGVLHRDLKPSNIMLGPYGETLLLDWGLAKKLGEPAAETTPEGASGSVSEETPDSTRQGQALGTPAFMSPEQAAGRRDELGPASDVYGLGATLYFLLTGQAPFSGDDLGAVLRKAERGEFSPPRQVKGEVPPALEAVCLKAMATRPGDRYPSAKALAEDLEHWLADEPVSAHREAWPGRLRRFVRRHPAAFISLNVFVAVTLLAALIGLMFVRKEQHQTETARQKLRTSLYYSRIEQAANEHFDNNVARTGELLEECDPELRSWEWHYLQRRMHEGPQRPLLSHAFYASVAFSPDGRLVASAGADGRIVFTDVATGKQAGVIRVYTVNLLDLFERDRDKLGRRYATVTGLAFSPDGVHLAGALSTLDKGVVKVWDVRTGVEVRTLRGHTEGVTGVAYSPDGKHLASCGWDRTVRLWEPGSGQEGKILRGHTDTICRLAFSPDGKRLASASWDGSVRVWDPATGDEVLRIQVDETELWCVAYSRDGRRLAAGSVKGAVWVWDSATGERLLRFTPELGLVSDVAFSHDGKRLACGGTSRAVRLFDTVTGQEVVSLRGHRNRVTTMAFSPDGSRLVSGDWDGEVRLWDGRPWSESGREVRDLAGNQTGVFAVAFSPDGQLVAGASMEGRVLLWDRASGREVLTYAGHSGIVSSLAFSADGKRIASGGFDGVRVWQTRTGQDVASYRGQRGHCWALSFSPDGRRLASSAGQRGEVKVWDTEKGEESLSIEGHLLGTFCLAFSPSGHRIATGGPLAIIKVWDATTGKALHTLAGHRDVVQGVAYSPGGKLLASASWDQTIKLWDVEEGREVRTLTGHADRVVAVAFHPDGKTLASASWDGTVKLWDVATGKELRTLRGHGGLVLCLAFAADGKTLVTGGGRLNKGEVKLWDLTTGNATTP